jgi:hypothetical protein
LLGSILPLTAHATCFRTATPEYHFSFRPEAGGTYTVIRGWDPSPTANWDTSIGPVPSGPYRLRVSTRAQGNPSDYEDFTEHPRFLVGNVCYTATIEAFPSSPRAPGTLVDFEATAQCRGGDPFFKYEILSPGARRTLCDWSASPHCSWDTTGVTEGTYRIGLQVRMGQNTATESSPTIVYELRAGVQGNPAPRTCTSDADCSSGYVCWLGEGPRFGVSWGTNVCVSPYCRNTPTPVCGTTESPCGKCENEPRLCTSDAQCLPGESCGEGNGEKFGLQSTDRVCWANGCSDPVYFAANCGTLTSACGRCANAHCQNGVKDAGESDVDCGGACPACSRGGLCASTSDCGDGLLCGSNNGGCFNGSRAESRCWAPECEDGVDEGLGECGDANSACGPNCACVVPCDADDPQSVCPSGEVCKPPPLFYPFRNTKPNLTSRGPRRDQALRPSSTI